MPQVRDFLSRFRPAGAPGAGRAPVPADRRKELELEAGSVLMLLDGPATESAEIIAAAHRDAQEIIRVARSEADSIVSAARQRAAADIAERVQEAVSAARTEAESIKAAGASEAAAIQECARQRLPALTDRAVALVRDLGKPAGPS